METIACEVSSDFADRLEEYFCGLEISHWALSRGVGEEKCRLCGYFESRDEAVDSWAGLRIVFPELSEEVEIGSIEEQDWVSVYKQYFTATQFGCFHCVPVWQRGSYEIPEGDEGLYLDATIAFGNGDHPTTFLCVEALLDFMGQRKGDLGKLSFIDAGCGSGILALIAAKYGFREVWGFDFDEDAVRFSQSNVAENELRTTPVFSQAQLEDALDKRKADVIAANIMADVLCEHAASLLKAVKAGGTLILSGILEVEMDGVLSRFQEVCSSLGFTIETARRTKEDWSALIILKRGDRS